MAIYEYWCSNCKQEFELMRPMSQSADPATCPTCSTTTTEKLPSVFASKEGYAIKVPEKGALRDAAHTSSTTPPPP